MIEVEISMTCLRCCEVRPHRQRYVYTPAGRQLDARVCQKCSTIMLVDEVVPPLPRI